MSEETPGAFPDFKTEYTGLRPILEKFELELRHQLDELLAQESVSLAVPVQSRVKDWDSIEEKLVRKPRDWGSIRDLPDLVGLRAILLFNRDVEKLRSVLSGRFHVLQQENKGELLEESQFGYLSIHLLIELPHQWLAVPSMADFGGLKAEVQIRTVAQHIWAEVSHKLQYKQENSVPPHVRRAIFRVSALLEFVDLELERILEERDQYQRNVGPPYISEALNVDSLARLLDTHLPRENKDAIEPYAELLDDLRAFSITTQAQLIALLEKHREDILFHEAESVEAIQSDEKLQQLHEGIQDRWKRGVFFTHVGLVRAALAFEFQEDWLAYQGDEDETE